PASGGTPRAVSRDFKYGVDEATWSKDGKAIYALCNMGVHSELFRIDVATGKAEQVTNGNTAAAGWTWSERNDRHVMTISTPSSPGEVYTLAPGNPKPVQVTRITEYVGRDFELPREEAIQWKGADGVTVEGILTYPIGYQAGKRYPLAVHTH